MAQLIVPGAAQMRLIWSLSGALYALNVIGVVNAGGIAITQTLTNTVGAAVKAAFTSSSMNTVLSTVVSLVNVGLRDIRSANQAEFLDVGAAVAGTLAGDFLPPQTALVITLRTAQAGPRFRGRIYFCGYGETQNGPLGTAIGCTTISINFAAAIKAALVSSSLDMGVIHRPTSAPLPISAGFITPVTAVVARDSVWDTQRRRAVPGI